ncbi:MAG TPA: ABC transporter permease subunit [Polyangiaceae bacterium]|jgi:peptide/nickel transport system permease protein|nr:ABC transporter permease subunit [Polyangiaceae bacterium]
MTRRALDLLPLAVVAAAAGLGVAISAEPAGRLVPARAWCVPSATHPLGCGEAGVDLLALVSWAELRAIALAVIVALVGLAVGTPLGAAAALARGRFERGVERACDLVQAFPSFILALAVLSAVRIPSRVHIGVVFALTAWAPFARLALAQTRVLRGTAFVEAAQALGRTRTGVLLRHVVPNLFGVVAVQLGATAAAVVVSEAGLAFVGLGPPDGVSLGGVVDQGVAAMLRAPHVLVVGATAVFVSSGALLAAGRALR